MKKLFFGVAMLLAATSAFAAKQTVRLVVAQMECSNCQAKVQKTLAYERGVKDLEFNLENRVVTVTYDDEKITVKDLQKSLLKNLKYRSRVLNEGDALPTFDKDDADEEEHHHEQSEE